MDLIQRRTLEATYSLDRDPRSSDDESLGVHAGEGWRNTRTKEVFQCLNASAKNAVWVNVTKRLSGAETVFGGTREFTADSILIPPAITGTINDYDPAGWRIDGQIVKSVLQLQSDGVANRQIRGLVPSDNPKYNIVTITNIGASRNIILVDNNGNAAAENRFSSRGNTTLAPRESGNFYYDPLILRWRAAADWK